MPRASKSAAPVTITPPPAPTSSAPTPMPLANRPPATYPSPRPPPGRPATAPACGSCGRGRMRVDGDPRKSDGAIPLRCSHCGQTGHRLDTGRVVLRGLGGALAEE